METPGKSRAQARTDMYCKKRKFERVLSKMKTLWPYLKVDETRRGEYTALSLQAEECLLEIRRLEAETALFRQARGWSVPTVYVPDFSWQV